MQFNRFPASVSAPDPQRNEMWTPACNYSRTAIVMKSRWWCISVRIHLSVRLCVVALLAIVAGIAWSKWTSADDRRSLYMKWVAELDSDSFHRRRAFAHRLEEAGIQDVEGDLVLSALHQGLAHRSREVQIAAGKIISQIRQRQLAGQVDRLLNPRVDPSAVNLPGWAAFSAVAGSDMQARRLFAELLDRYPGVIRRLSLSRTDHAGDTAAIRFDPEQLVPGDTLGWTMLLMLETLDYGAEPPRFASPTMIALCSLTRGPKFESSRFAPVIRRIVDRWIGVRIEQCPKRECLRIALRYGCTTRAKQLCQMVFEDPMSTPATLVTALLGGSVLLVVTSPKLTGLVFLVVPVVLLPILTLGRRVRRLSRLSHDRVADLGVFGDESLTSIRTVQAFGHEAVDRFFERLNMRRSGES